MTDAEFGLFAVDADSRTVRGILIPWGEASRVSQTKNAPVTFRQGDVRIPRDHTVVTLNRQHDRYDPIGRASAFDPEHERGLFAEWAIAATDEGDAWLADHGNLVRLSPELRDIIRHPDGTTTATLTGAGLVSEGSFASAGLFAVDADESQVPDTLAPEDAAPAAEEEGSDVTSIVPTDAAPVAPTPTPEPTPVAREDGQFAAGTSANELFSALTRAVASGDRRALDTFARAEAETGLFAAYAPLNDITATMGATTFPPQFLGEIYRKDAFLQTTVPLFLHDDLKSLQVSGWAWGTRPTVGAYAGDKAAIPTNTPTFAAVSTTAERIAGGHDVDRALRDFANDEFWASYFRIMVEEYKKLADSKVLTKISAAAPVVAPTAVSGTQDPGTMAVIDGALAVIANGYTPSFAIVSSAIFRSFLVTPKDKVLEYLSSAFAIDASAGPGPAGGEGRLGGFRIVPNSTLTAKRVIVGSRQAATVYELPGAAPVRVEGLDVAHAGIDPAVYGYIATLINDPLALASVTTL